MSRGVEGVFRLQLCCGLFSLSLKPAAAMLTQPAGLQECLRSVIAAIGPDRARALWVPLLDLETSNPREWQWLAVLACW